MFLLKSLNDEWRGWTIVKSLKQSLSFFLLVRIIRFGIHRRMNEWIANRKLLKLLAYNGNCHFGGRPTSKTGINKKKTKQEEKNWKYVCSKWIENYAPQRALFHFFFPFANVSVQIIQRKYSTHVEEYTKNETPK